MFKSCFKCGERKSIDEFYKMRGMSDGHLGKCKECTKKDVKDRYDSPESRAKILEYEKKRARDPYRRAKALQYQKNRRALSPEKDKARNAVSNAIRDGRLIRLPCIVCGDEKSQAHHHDYRKPLDVYWYCFKHHREIGHQHSLIKALNEKSK